MDSFTAQVLDKAGSLVDLANEQGTEEWFDERGLDQDTVQEFTRAVVKKATVPLTKATLVTVGIMFGIELGKMMCDPSYNLQRELTR